ncbi:Nuclear cap-binding protein subunit 3 [Liparis tanakae]|uniref:Nuclear cap-binding protein subunit 3 n=1 Tax=Liparis tanakae TaxID=230148 RepID=A0A4Z2G3T9_9TELE|nr:Nuclear cap-binding protein subunit 3 [Liparis tanakae]
MAAVRSLMVAVKSNGGSDRSASGSDSDSDHDAREAEPMEVEEGELETEDVSVSRSLKELLPDTSRRYENKGGAFITGIDVNSKEAIEKKEKRARRFHFTPEENVEQRSVVMDKDTMKKGGRSSSVVPMACNVVWLDDNTSVRVLVNCSRAPDPEAPDPEAPEKESPETETLETPEVESAAQPVEQSKDDKKELGAARRSRYYMKYGNPNYGGMKGVLSNSWKRRFHNRRIQRDVIKTKKPLIGDNLGHTPPYTHRHSADLVNLPEEPIKEEDEEDEEDEDMEEDDRVVEYKERGDKERGDKERGQKASGEGSRPAGAGLRGRVGRSPSPWSESDEMDYDLELKMISTPSPKKSKKMTMYADELDGHLKSIRNRVGESGSQTRAKSTSPPPQLTDVRQLLEEKRKGLAQHRGPPLVAPSGKSDVRQRLGKRRYSPDRQRSPSPVSPRDTPPAREPIRDVHRRLGVASQDNRSVKDRKSSALWSRLGSSDEAGAGRHERRSSSRQAELFSSGKGGEGGGSKARGDGEGEKKEEKKKEDEEDDSTLQKVWGAMIKQKQERMTHEVKKSRLDNLPSLQIEISRDSSDDSDA